MKEETMKQIFEGVKVADFTWVIAGPRATQYLAEHGATVIKIESTSYPDTLRTAGPFKDNKPGLNRTAYFARYNTNKLSVALNLNHPKGPEIARKLVQWADIVSESYLPGRMKKWGLAYEDLVKIKPDLIMFSTNNQGQTGPLAFHPGYGVQLSSLAGFTHITGWPDRDPAGLFGAYTDFIVPQFIVSSLAAALINRKKTGNGIYLDFSQLECAAHFLGPKIMEWATNKREDNRMGNRVSFASPHGVFRCMGEDEWVAISVSTDQQWEGLKRAMGNPAWLEEERLSLFSGRKEKEDDLEKLVEAWTINQTSKEVMELLQKEGVPAGSVLKNRDVYDDPQLSYREQFMTLSHPEIGNYPAEGPPFKFSRTPARLERPAPCLGEHTFGVCTEFLGISDEEFSQLMAEGVLE